MNTLHYTNDGRCWHLLRDEKNYPAFYATVDDAKIAARRLWAGKRVQWRIENAHGDVIA